MKRANSLQKQTKLHILEEIGVKSLYKIAEKKRKPRNKKSVEKILVFFTE